jgi:hypothetical protein
MKELKKMYYYRLQNKLGYHKKNYVLQQQNCWEWCFLMRPESRLQESNVRPNYLRVQKIRLPIQTPPTVNHTDITLSF